MVGNEKLPTFALSKTNKLYNIMEKKIYQPISKETKELPFELYSWQVFLTKKNVIRWLIMQYYNPNDFNIEEYDESDIEDYSIVNIFNF